MIYYKDSSNMNEIENNSVALVATSPPYPMISKWDNLFKTVDFEDQHQQLDAVWEECERKLMPGGIICINIGDATRTINKNFCCYPNHARITMKMHHLGFSTLIPIIWKKSSNRQNAFLGSGFLPPNAYVSHNCEMIGIYRKGRIRKFTPKEKVRLDSKYTKAERDLWFQQIWTVTGKRGAREIPYRLIRMFSIINDIVVDPFSGTGTTQRIAETLNRIFIGYEKQSPEKRNYGPLGLVK